MKKTVLCALSGLPAARPVPSTQRGTEERLAVDGFVGVVPVRQSGDPGGGDEEGFLEPRERLRLELRLKRQ